MEFQLQRQSQYVSTEASSDLFNNQFAALTQQLIATKHLEVLI